MKYQDKIIMTRLNGYFSDMKKNNLGTVNLVGHQPFRVS